MKTSHRVFNLFRKKKEKKRKKRERKKKPTVRGIEKLPFK